MTKQVLSVQPTTFTDQKDGSQKSMWKVFVADDSGAVGSIYSNKEVKTGDTITLGMSVNRDGKLVAKIITPAVIGGSPAKGKKDGDLPF